MSDGGRLVPEILEDQVYEMLTRPNPVWDKYRPTFPPPTRRQLLMMRIRGIRWAIHDRFFNCGCCDD